MTMTHKFEKQAKEFLATMPGVASVEYSDDVTGSLKDMGLLVTLADGTKFNIAIQKVRK